MKVTYLETLRMQTRLEKIAEPTPEPEDFLGKKLTSIQQKGIRSKIQGSMDDASPRLVRKLKRQLKGQPWRSRQAIARNFWANRAAQAGRGTPLLKSLGKAGKGLAATLALGGAVGGGAAIADKLHESASSKGNFRAMMDAYPSLRKQPKADVQKRFKALQSFGGPHITSNPIAAGSFIKRTMELGGDIDIKSVAELAKIRKDLAAGGSSPLGKKITDIAAPGLKVKTD